jgi:serine/threonine protein kinase
MEYCSGKTLDAYLQKKKKIPEKEAVDILRQIINGIAVSSISFRNSIVTK